MNCIEYQGFNDNVDYLENLNPERATISSNAYKMLTRDTKLSLVNALQMVKDFASFCPPMNIANKSCGSYKDCTSCWIDVIEYDLDKN